MEKYTFLFSEPFWLLLTEKKKILSYQVPNWDLLIEYPLFRSSEDISLLKFVLSYLCVNQVELCWLECQFRWLLMNKKNVLVECAFDI